MAEWQQQSSDSLAKRQRRPSVRLGEIGGQPAALLSESGLVKRKKADQMDGPPITYAFQSPLPPPLKLGKVTPHNSASPEQNSSSFSGEGQIHDALLPSPISSQSPLLEQIPTRPNSSDDTLDRKITVGLSLSNNWGRNGKRKRGGIQKLRRAFPSVVQIDGYGSEKASGDAIYLPSDKPNDDGILETDCQALEVSTDCKETSRVAQDDQADGGTLSDSICEFPLQVLVADDCFPDQGENTVEEKEGSADIHVSPVADTSDELFGAVHDKNIRRIPSQAKVSEAEMCLENMEAKREREIDQDEQQQPEVGRLASLMKGVNEWLCDLGLGRYMPVFEVHEVDTEVLPFLTLDDLKEMGISAVGTRRKIFYAIQCLGKGK